MSAIASFIKLPKAALPAVRGTATQNDVFHDFLKFNGTEVTQYDWSGYVLATLLPFLDEKGIHLMKAEEADLAHYLCERRQATCVILTSTQKKYVEQLAPASFSESSLQDYYNEFNETEEEGVGEAMLDGVRAFRESLESLDDDSVVLVTIE